ncbi:MAG: GNAT family protein, partial [Pseudomonadota bacterium]
WFSSGQMMPTAMGREGQGSMAPRPQAPALSGDYVAIAPWNPDLHGPSLWASFGQMKTNELLYHFGWSAMEKWEDLAAIIDGFNQSGAFITCIFTDKDSGDAIGMASYMSIVPEHGRIEVGAVAHGKGLRSSPAATEAHYLLARHVFDDLGYRRYEWKLNNPNEASHKAARRLGFTFEGVFRQHQVMTYGNRDTAWYSMLDSEWPRAKKAFQAWLMPDNFDAGGRQKLRLAQLREMMA